MITTYLIIHLLCGLRAYYTTVEYFDDLVTLPKSFSPLEITEFKQSYYYKNRALGALCFLTGPIGLFSIWMTQKME